MTACLPEIMDTQLGNLDAEQPCRRIRSDGFVFSDFDGEVVAWAAVC
jgi:hypothetical protein